MTANLASLLMLAHIAGDQIMTASHALSALPQMSRLRHGVQPIIVNTAEQPCHPMEEADPLTAVVEGIKQAPSNMSGSLSQDNTSLLSLAKTPINIQKLKRELVGYDPRKVSKFKWLYIRFPSSLDRCSHAKGCKELKICKNKTRCSWAKK